MYDRLRASFTRGARGGKTPAGDGPGSESDPGRGTGATAETAAARSAARPGPGAASETGPPGTLVDSMLEKVARWSLRVLLIAGALVIVGWVIQQTWSLLLPLVLALLLSTILWPLMRLMRKAMPPSLAAFAVLLAFIAILAAIVSLLVPRVADEGAGLVRQLYAAVDDVRTLLTGSFLNLDADRITGLLDGALKQLQQHQQAIASGVLSGFSSIGSFAINFVLVLFLVFFLLKDGPKFIPWLHRWLPARGGAHVDALAGRIWTMLTGFIWSQAAVALIDAVLIGAGLWILDVPFAFPISVLIFFASFIPIIGAIATGVLATLVALVDQGIWIAATVLAIVLVVQQLEGNVLQPFLVGRTLSLHPAVVLGAVTVGGTVFGIVGAFLAVPVVGAGVTALRYAREQVSGPDGEPAEEGTGASDSASEAESKKTIS